MTALAAERLTQRMDSSGVAAGPDKLNLGIAANEIGWQGGIACVNTSGNGVNGKTATGLTCVGRWSLDFNATGLGTNALNVDVEQGVFKYASSIGADVIAQANVGSLAYIIDDQTVGLTSGGGTRSIAGVIMQVDADGVWVKMGIDTGALAAVVLNNPQVIPQRSIGNSRAVRVATVAALAAYTAASGVLTATANGALGTIDGVTMAVGDRVLLTLGAAGADNGIYVVTSLGSAGSKFVFTRAADYATGSVVFGGLVVEVSEGTVFGQSTWKLTTAGASTVDTTSVAFYPRFQKGQQALTAGAATVSNVWVLAATGANGSKVALNDTTAAAAVKGTLTAGAGTGTLVLAGTTTDTIDFCIINW